jgi:LacI family transcriptional regulator
VNSVVGPQDDNTGHAGRAKGERLRSSVMRSDGDKPGVSERAPGGRATLDVIAERAGVSKATVSRVINGRTEVSAATRARVQRMLAEHNYVPPQRTTSTVDLIFADLDSEWAVEILRGVETYLSDSGRPVAVSSVPRGSPARPASWTGTIARHHPAGVLLVMSQVSPAQWRELREQHIPLVVIDPADVPAPNVPSVGATNWAGGIAATEHLLQLGHRRIGVISGPESYLCSRARTDGYRHALQESGIPYDPQLVRWGDFRHEGGYRFGHELLSRVDRPTAIFAGSDQQALGVYEAARQLGLSVPRDVSIVGFDDLPFTRWVPPPLTTIRQPLTQMGAMAAEMLMRLIDGRTLTSQRVELATELVVRESTAPIDPRT